VTFEEDVGKQRTVACASRRISFGDSSFSLLENVRVKTQGRHRRMWIDNIKRWRKLNNCDCEKIKREGPGTKTFYITEEEIK